jgi:hypothetical protein
VLPSGLATREDAIVVEESPRRVDLLSVPRGPTAASASLRALSARETTDLLLDLPRDETKVAARVAPAEVVHPSSDSRVDDAPNDLDDRAV